MNSFISFVLVEDARWTRSCLSKKQHELVRVCGRSNMNSFVLTEETTWNRPCLFVEESTSTRSFVFTGETTFIRSRPSKEQQYLVRVYPRNVVVSFASVYRRNNIISFVFIEEALRISFEFMGEQSLRRFYFLKHWWSHVRCLVLRSISVKTKRVF